MSGHASRKCRRSGGAMRTVIDVLQHLAGLRDRHDASLFARRPTMRECAVSFTVYSTCWVIASTTIYSRLDGKNGLYLLGTSS